MYIQNQFYSNQLHYLQALHYNKLLIQWQYTQRRKERNDKSQKQIYAMKKVKRSCATINTAQDLSIPSVRLLIASRRILSVSAPSRITCKQVWTHSSLKATTLIHRSVEATMLIHRSLEAKSFYQPKSSEYQNWQCMYRYLDSNTIIIL